MQPIASYIRMQGIICAVINVLLNPAVAWLGYRQLDFVPLWGRASIVVDTPVTAVMLSLLVTLFVTSGVRRALQTGRVSPTNGFPRAGCLLSHLPQRAWPLGLLLGLGSASILTPLTLVLLQMFGYSGLPLSGFALFKAMYTGPLGFAVTRWVILRQLLV